MSGVRHSLRSESRNTGSFRGKARLAMIILGTLPVVLLMAAALALFLPMPLTWGVRVGCYALLPAWALVSGCTFLAESKRDAWVSLICLAALTALLSASVLMLEHLLVHGARG